MQKTYNILSLLLDYPTAELRDSLPQVAAAVAEEALLGEEATALLRQFLGYAGAFGSLREWQSSYTELFDTATKANLYLFDFVYGTSKDRGQAMVDLKEEYLKAGLMPREDELPDYLPMYLQYAAALDTPAEAQAALADLHGVLDNMRRQFAAAGHPYRPLIDLLFTLSA